MLVTYIRFIKELKEPLNVLFRTTKIVSSGLVSVENKKTAEQRFPIISRKIKLKIRMPEDCKSLSRMRNGRKIQTFTHKCVDLQ
jgi:hypothetical protein